MRKIVCILSLLVLMMAGVALAQSPVAKFIFEDAEEAFAKQDYKTTLEKLEEAEKEFGKINPPILYLRIMARNELLKANPTDFDTIERLRSETTLFLKEYGNLESVQDKAREVYKVSAELKQYPATKVEYEAWFQAVEAKRKEEELRRKAEEARRLLAEERNVRPVVLIETSLGSVKIELDRVKAPISVKNFLSYEPLAKVLSVVRQAHHEREKVNRSNLTTVHPELVEGYFGVLQEPPMSTINSMTAPYSTGSSTTL